MCQYTPLCCARGKASIRSADSWTKVCPSLSCTSVPLLTPSHSEWSDLRKELIPIIDDMCIKLEEHRRKDVLVLRLVQLKSLIEEVATSDADLANIPPCHYANLAMDSDVEDKIRQFPGNDELSPEVLDTVREKLTAEKLRQDFEWRLSRQFPSLVKQHRDQSLKDHPLALFMCYHGSCNAGKTGPLTSITAMHSCLCDPFTPRKLCLLEKVPGGAYDYAVREVFQFAPWEFVHLKLHWNSGIMKHLMELGGIDPALGTAQDMDKADFFVQCHSCKNKVRGMTMGWRTAVCCLYGYLLYRALIGACSFTTCQQHILQETSIYDLQPRKRRSLLGRSRRRPRRPHVRTMRSSRSGSVYSVLLIRGSRF